ncbi:putative metalloprotease CJM1_0395 family protein [Oceanidesulfovibrio marinus]|nr:putative metalloprotease CJM1_0395 family protein [Oceanidesulfovibrio marinus]
MDHIFQTVLGLSPAPRPRAIGPEPIDAVQGASRSRGSGPDAASGSGRTEDAASANTATHAPTAAQRTHRSSVAAVGIEASMGKRDLNELSTEELARVSELQQRDTEVRNHEQAHVAAGGGHVVGGARYDTTEGPDGEQYATSGEVSIDTSPVPGNPEATMEKAHTVRRAALAPAQPSGQDRAVAAKASAMEAQARMEAVQERKTQPSAYGFAGETAGNPFVSIRI